jgi:hypothetical protein
MRYRCPVCLFSGLPYAPNDYHICPCCGTEFGNDDQELTHPQLREMWLANGANWFFGEHAPDWNPYMQLIEGGHPEAVPVFALGVSAEPTMVSPYTVRTSDAESDLQLQLVA